MMRLSNNPSREEQRGKEYVLASLPLAAKFVSRGILGGPDTYGTLLEVTPGRCIVAIIKPPKHVTIGGHEFDTAASRNVGWPHEVPVEYLGQDENYELEGEQSPEQEQEITMARKSKNNTMIMDDNNPTTTEAPATTTEAPATADATTAAAPSTQTSFITTAADAVAANEGNSKAKVIISRWIFATGKLADLLKNSAAADLLTPARVRVTNTYDEAVAAGVILPLVNEDLARDEVFTGMQLGMKPAPTGSKKKNGGKQATEAAAAAPGTGTASESGTEESDMAKANKKSTSTSTAKRAVKKATAAKKSAQPREKKVKVLVPCGCGCGEQVTGNFKQGHDARYKGRLLRVERGEEQTKDLPAGMLKFGGKGGVPLEFKKAGDGHKATNSRLNH